MNFQNRTLFHGDNLQFLREIDSNTIVIVATVKTDKEGNSVVEYWKPGDRNKE